MTSVENRKLIGLGGSVVVSLPVHWLNYHNRGVGDSVRIITKGGVAEISFVDKDDEGVKS